MDEGTASTGELDHSGDELNVGTASDVTAALGTSAAAEVVTGSGAGTISVEASVGEAVTTASLLAALAEDAEESEGTG